MNTRKIQKKRSRKLKIFILLAVIAAALAVMLIPKLLTPPIENEKVWELKNVKLPDYVDVQLIRVDGASRRGTPLEEINDIAIHYVGNPGTTAKQNRNYFNNPDSSVSSHFLIGLDGEVIQCLPLWEKSSATNDRNRDTISIEVCHPDESGEFTAEAYASLVKLTAFLIDACGLEASDIIRHYDVTGKECPRYFVQNEEAWEAFKSDVAEAILQ